MYLGTVSHGGRISIGQEDTLESDLEVAARPGCPPSAVKKRRGQEPSAKTTTTGVQPPCPVPAVRAKPPPSDLLPDSLSAITALERAVLDLGLRKEGSPLIPPGVTCALLIKLGTLRTMTTAELVTLRAENKASPGGTCSAGRPARVAPYASAKGVATGSSAADEASPGSASADPCPRDPTTGSSRPGSGAAMEHCGGAEEEEACPDHRCRRGGSQAAASNCAYVFSGSSSA